MNPHSTWRATTHRTDPVHNQPAGEGGQSNRYARLSRWKLMAAGIGLLVIAFNVPLRELLSRGLHEEIYSHVLLVPFISGYLVWIQRNDFVRSRNRDFPLAMFAAVTGLSMLLGYGAAVTFGGMVSDNDQLSLLMFSFVCLVSALCLTVNGKENASRLTFPLGFLLLMVPFPTVVLEGITTFLQFASAEAAYVFIKLSGTPVLRDGLVFNLPGLAPVEVAAECSGIRSTLVLLITSLVGGYLFLKQSAGKWWLATAAIPIGILRNGFRILALVWLSIHVDHGILDGPVHHRGGPIFFLLSLVPLLGLLVFLKKRERRTQSQSRR